MLSSCGVEKASLNISSGAGRSRKDRVKTGHCADFGNGKANHVFWDPSTGGHRGCSTTEGVAGNKLGELVELGIADSALTWFTSYLTNRTFQVTWNDSLSTPCFLETDVPQGSLLGPHLFSLYTRSLGSAVTSHGFSYHCYADDTQLFLSFPHPLIPTCISECLADISTWTAVYHLKLNLSKAELFFIPVKDCPCMDLSVTVEDVSITFVVCEEPVRNPQWPTLLHPQHHCCDPILQICPLQHLQDLVFPHKGHKASPGPSADHLPPGLLQFALGWTPNLYCSPPRFQSFQIFPYNPPPLWLPLASCCGPHLIQGDGAGLQGRQCNCTHLPPNTAQNSSPSASTLLYYISWLSVTPIAESKQRSLSESQLFSVLMLQQGNELLPNVRTAESLAIFCKRLKTHWFRLYLDPT